MWQNDRSAEAPGRLENLKELVRSMEEFETLRAFLEHVALVMDGDEGATRRRRLDHDAAFGQGAGIRHRLPARLGGRPVPAPARARRGGPRRASRKNAASPMSASPAPAAAPASRSPPTAASTALAIDHPLALPRRTAGSRMSRSPRVQGRLRLGRQPAATAHRASTSRTRSAPPIRTPGWQRAQANRARS